MYENVYLGVVGYKNSGCRKEIENRVVQGRKTWRCNLKEEGLRIDAVKELYGGMVVPTLLYGSEILTWYEYDRYRV